ncbi:MAG: uroporphyrinogen decarboxylase [Actinomycetota bacterium]
MVHLIGFAGSALIIGSVLMRSVVRLRVLGLSGSLTFIVYGVVLGAWPIVVTNGLTTAIHVARLRRLAGDARARSNVRSLAADIASDP